MHDIALIGVAKGPDRDAGREHFHFPGRDRPIMLEPRDPVLYFVQRLRDEAHRFAIGTHRAKRAKAISANPLDEIAGIGPTRKRALLKHFGSAKAVSRAGIEDLKAVDGISAEMAQKSTISSTSGAASATAVAQSEARPRTAAPSEATLVWHYRPYLNFSHPKDVRDSSGQGGEQAAIEKRVQCLEHSQ